MHELMMSPAGKTALRSVLILAIFLASWNVARVAGKRLEQRRNSLHVRFAVSCAKGLIAIAAVAAFCMQFSMTREFALTLFQSASLMVAVIGFAAQAVLADVIAGMVLSFAKPFDTGERIVLEDTGIAGIVETITTAAGSWYQTVWSTNRSSGTVTLMAMSLERFWKFRFRMKAT